MAPIVVWPARGAKIRWAYFSLCSVLMTITAAHHGPSSWRTAGAIEALAAVLNLLGISTTILGAWKNLFYAKPGAEHRLSGAIVDAVWVAIFSLSWAANCTVKVHDFDHLPVAALTVCVAAFLELPLLMTSAISAGIITPCFLYTEYQLFRTKQQATAADAAAAMTSCEVDLGQLCAAEPVEVTSFLLRAGLIVIVLAALPFTAQILINGRVIMAARRRTLHGQLSLGHGRHARPAQASAAGDPAPGSPNGDPGPRAGEEQGAAPPPARPALAEWHLTPALTKGRHVLHALADATARSGVARALFNPLRLPDAVERWEADICARAVNLVAIRMLAPLACIPIVLYTLFMCFLSIMHSKAADGSGREALLFTPTWVLLSGISAALAARLDIGGILHSYMEQQQHSQQAQASLESLRVMHAALLEERQALQAQLDNYKPRSVLDAGTPASKLLSLLGQLLTGGGALLPREELEHLQSVLLRGLDVYQPENLAAKLAASASDAEIGAMMAVTLGCAATDRPAEAARPTISLLKHRALSPSFPAVSRLGGAAAAPAVVPSPRKPLRPKSQCGVPLGASGELSTRSGGLQWASLDGSESGVTSRSSSWGPTTAASPAPDAGDEGHHVRQRTRSMSVPVLVRPLGMDEAYAALSAHTSGSDWGQVDAEQPPLSHVLLTIITSAGVAKPPSPPLPEDGASSLPGTPGRPSAPEGVIMVAAPVIQDDDARVGGTQGAQPTELCLSDSALASAHSASPSPDGAHPSMVLLDRVEQLLAEADDWEFNIFELEAASQGHALSALAFFLISRSGLIQQFQLNAWVLARYLFNVEAGYLPNPYHNKTHVAHVLHRNYIVLQRGGFVPHYVDNLSLLACLLAATVHDYEHLGVTNDFLVTTQDPLAILYNDKAPLENHHLAASWALVQQPGCDVFGHMPRASQQSVRKLIIDLVLATDMKLHFSLLSQFTTVHASPDAVARRTSHTGVPPGGGSGVTGGGAPASVGSRPGRQSGSGAATPQAGSVGGGGSSRGLPPPPRRHSFVVQPMVAGGAKPLNSRKSSLATYGSPSPGDALSPTGSEMQSGGSLLRQLSAAGRRQASVLGPRRIAWREGNDALASDARSVDEPISAPGHIDLLSVPERSAASTTVLELDMRRMRKISPGMLQTGAGAASRINAPNSPASDGRVTARSVSSSALRHPDASGSPQPPASPLTPMSGRTSMGSLVSSPPPPPDPALQVKPLDENERLLSLQIALKAADLCNLCDPLHTHVRWVGMLEEEFFRQGDIERRLGLPISPLFDRTKPGVSKSQVAFMDIVAVPLFRALASSFPGTDPLLKGLMANYSYWLDQGQAGTAKTDAPASAPPAAAAAPAPVSSSGKP